MVEFHFISLSMILSFLLIEKINSILDDEENQIYYIKFDLSDKDFKYKNDSEKIEDIILINENFITIPTILLKKKDFILMVGLLISFMGMPQVIYFIQKKKIPHFFRFLKTKMIQHILDLNTK